ncbi:MAG: AAA family ATPase [Sulfolobales archaeon]|nr:AAA family ATPase [Sulfolobales archaeon]MCX8186264.1 AAA family ATPase [Sulfolobales archaeon]MDW7969000.1 AAA family ATPase [Sulfolobales archaeon]
MYSLIKSSNLLLLKVLSIETTYRGRYLFICVAGMPGSGKTLIVNGVKHLVDMAISMGDVVRREAMRRGIEMTPKSIMEFAKQVRREGGSDFIAKEVIKEVLNKDVEVVLVDGVRSLEEVNTFRKFGDVYVIAIHSSPKTRFLRLISRGRDGDPSDWDDFMVRDLSELELGLGSVIALADLMIVNEDLSVDELVSQVVNKVRELVRR